ncbi:hypothetical protein G6F50_018638 [Rhizopus delemar]|uniref:Uncharacterized protein n=2 Tax=cellular organisms TaxID=131567 RepID=A0A9P6XM39_9FUNG|nr:hypothetical protein G6F50_018638 [Rhizopus delemar]
MPGLTFQNGLDRFWTQGQKPDSNFYRKFRNVVIAHSQVNGGFYSRRGITLAVQNSLPKLLLPPRQNHSEIRLRKEEVSFY